MNEVFRSAKDFRRKKAAPAFFIFTFETAVVFFLNFSLFYFERVGIDYPKRLLPAAFAALTAVLILFFRALNLRFFSFKPEGKPSLKRFFGSVAFESVLFLLRLVVFAFCLSPFLLLFFFSVFAAENAAPLSAVSVMLAFCAALFFFGLFFYGRFGAFLFLAPFVYFYDKNSSFFSAIKTGGRIIDGKSKTLFKIKKRLYPSFLLCLFIFPLPFVWEYQKRVLAVFAYRLIEENSVN